MLFETVPDQDDDFLANLDSEFNQDHNIEDYELAARFDNCNNQERIPWK